MNAPSAVVVGLSVTGLGIVRSLARSGIGVIGVESHFNKPSAHTRYCEKVSCANIDGEEELLETLIGIGKRSRSRLALFLSTDMSVLITSEKREILRENFSFNLPSKNTVKTLLDKTLFAEFAGRKGFHTPQTFIVNNIGDVESICGRMSYPCVIKPSFRQPVWDRRTPIKVFKASSSEELIGLYQEKSSLAAKFVIQELIPGPDSEVYFCLLWYNSLSKPIGIFTGRKLVQWMPELGSTCIAESSINSMVLKESIRLFDCAKYQGIGSVEFKRDPRDNQLKIIEPTVGRADLQSAMAYYHGINIPLLEYCDCLGLEAPELKFRKRKTFWVNEENLIWLLISPKGRDYRKEWLRVIRSRKKYALFELMDIGPFIYFLLSIIRTIVRKLSPKGS